jgi:Cu(I)/Ag(I) efflux system membrane protein CusA/SilA
MKRIAAPMVGGMITSTILTLVVIPAIYLIWRRWQIARRPASVVRGALADPMALTPEHRETS